MLDTCMSEKSLSLSSSESTAFADSLNQDPQSIVVIGATEENLEDLNKLLMLLPQESRSSFIVIQELSQRVGKHSADSIKLTSNLQLKHVTKDTRLEANTIYLITTPMQVSLSQNRLIVDDETPRISTILGSFLVSLAQSKQYKSVAILYPEISHAALDGLRYFTKNKGQILLYRKDSVLHAEHPPGDYLLQQIANFSGSIEQIAIFLRNSIDSGLHNDHTASFEDHGVKKIFSSLQNKYGVDFSLYKTSTINRKLVKNKELHQLDNFSDLANKIESQPNAKSNLYYDLLIGVTEFFRDPDAFDTLQTKIIPKLIENRSTEDEIRIWVCGCSSGEEVYSLAILFTECCKALRKFIPIKIFGSDIDDRVLRFASEGSYSKESLKSLPVHIVKRYFSYKSNRYKIKPEIRQCVIFSQHNVLQNPPFTKLDMVSCRNVLIYFNEVAQTQAISSFYSSLNQDGILFLGPSEFLGKMKDDFKILNSKWKIFGKVGNKRLRRSYQSPFQVCRRSLSKSTSERISLQDKLTINRKIKSQDIPFISLLNKFIPTSLLINEKTEILHIFGNAGEFVAPRSGILVPTLEYMMEEQLALAATVSMHKARRQKAEIVYKDVLTSQGNVDLKVSPIQGNSDSDNLFLVRILKHSDRRHQTESTLSDKAFSDRISLLEEQLQNTRDNLRITVEELETTNEELHAANEALISSNEEIQSTNEVLQAVNEELQLVNFEYQRKLSELEELATDEENILRASCVGAIFLDSQLRIRKFTSAIRDNLNLTNQDIGQTIGAIIQAIQLDSLPSLVQKVQRTRISEKIKVQNRDGHDFLMRILPHEGSLQHAMDIVLTFIQINL